jgi:hypothetical protein
MNRILTKSFGASCTASGSLNKTSILSRQRLKIGLSSDKFLHTQGCGIFGALGHGSDLMDIPSFKKLDISKLTGLDITVSQVSTGWGHSAGVTDEGFVFVMGRLGLSVGLALGLGLGLTD